MRLLRLTTLYPGYIRRFYEARPGLRRAEYSAQKEALDADAFGWADFWRVALAPLGYEVWDVPLNVEPLQRAWARQHLPPGALHSDPEEIASRQARAFHPDILWFDDDRANLLHRLRTENGSIRTVLGWSGSSIVDTEALREVDLMLSCSPEAVGHYRRRGLRSEVLHHAFDPRVGERLGERHQRWNVTFIGQLLAGAQYHDTRRRLLESALDAVPLSIFSPDGDASIGSRLRALARSGLGRVARGLRRARVSERLLHASPLLRRAATWPVPGKRLSPRLRREIKPAVYGMAMYRVLSDSAVTLNIHADSSPRYASNMRLYEATGVGACLLTDWKENLGSLFEADREVVTFRTPEECVEKARWLLENPAAREAIARGGRARTLRDHTFARRASDLDWLIRGALR